MNDHRLLGSAVKRVYLTGGAGFIGSHVVDLLVPQGYQVTVVDNLSNGREEFIRHHYGKPNFTFLKGDVSDLNFVLKTLPGHDLVWHLAANTDIIGSHARPERDLRDCLIAAFNMVEGMRQLGIQPILFSSTGAVYGDLCKDRLVNETAGPLLPQSTYAAGKISSEAFIACYCNLYGLRAWMFRFGNVLGARMTHGVIFDFINKLRKNPDELLILGDGTQSKNYFLVEDCIGGMSWAFQNVKLDEKKPVELLNLGTTTTTRVTEIGRIVIEEMGLAGRTQVKIAGTPRAWPGDQPKVNFSVDKINGMGWHAPRSSDESVRTAIRRMLGKTDR